jgi:hypothetical protein
MQTFSHARFYDQLHQIMQQYYLESTNDRLKTVSNFLHALTWANHNDVTQQRHYDMDIHTIEFVEQHVHSPRLPNVYQHLVSVVDYLLNTTDYYMERDAIICERIAKLIGMRFSSCINAHHFFPCAIQCLVSPNIVIRNAWAKCCKKTRIADRFHDSFVALVRGFNTIESVYQRWDYIEAIMVIAANEEWVMHDNEASPLADLAFMIVTETNQPKLFPAAAFALCTVFDEKNSEVVLNELLTRTESEDPVIRLSALEALFHVAVTMTSKESILRKVLTMLQRMVSENIPINEEQASFYCSRLDAINKIVIIGRDRPAIINNIQDQLLLYWCRIFYQCHNDDINTQVVQLITTLEKRSPDNFNRALLSVGILFPELKDHLVGFVDSIADRLLSRIEQFIENDSSLQVTYSTDYPEGDLFPLHNVITVGIKYLSIDNAKRVFLQGERGTRLRKILQAGVNSTRKELHMINFISFYYLLQLRYTTLLWDDKTLLHSILKPLLEHAITDMRDCDILRAEYSFEHYLVTYAQCYVTGFIQHALCMDDYDTESCRKIIDPITEFVRDWFVRFQSITADIRQGNKLVLENYAHIMAVIHFAFGNVPFTGIAPLLLKAMRTIELDIEDQKDIMGAFCELLEDYVINTEKRNEQAQNECVLMIPSTHVALILGNPVFAPQFKRCLLLLTILTRAT